MKQRYFLLIICSLLWTNLTFSQKENTRISITGKVLDAMDNPVPNAIILIDGEKTNYLTDKNGEFSIKIRKNNQMIGIFTIENGLIEQPIDGSPELVIKLSKYVVPQTNVEIDDPGEEAVNTGYTHTKKKYKTTEITKIDGTDKKYASYSTIYDMIQRECAGVRVTGTTIIIQDSKNMLGSVPPLFVVDGAYTETIENISPRSVESIEVLKGTSAAMYGSRGFGGVIIIKTKLGN